MATRQTPFGMESPSLFAALAGTGVAAAIIILQPKVLSSFAVFVGSLPSLASGATVLGGATLLSILKVFLTLIPVVLSMALLLSLVLGQPRLSASLRLVFTILANLPVFLILPIWLVVFGNDEIAGLAFLAFCFAGMVGYLVFSDEAGAPLAQRIATSFDLSRMRAFRLVLEVVINSMRLSIFQILVLGLPLALAAELLANRSGLGYIAFSAYQNGNFQQLGISAAAYVIGFCALWSAWACLLALPDLVEHLGEMS